MASGIASWGRLSASAAVFAVGLSAGAADIKLKAGDAGGVSSFNSGANWEGGAAPCAGNVYYTNGKSLRTPEKTGTPSSTPIEYTFAGDALCVNGGYLTLKTIGETYTVRVDDLRMQGGHVAVSSGGGPARLLGNMSVKNDCYAYGDNGNVLWLESALSGASSVNFKIRNWSGEQNSFLIAYLKGDNSGYLGRFVADQKYSMLVFEGENSLGGNPGWMKDKLYLQNEGAMAFSSKLPQPVFCPGGMMCVAATGGSIYGLDGETTTLGFTISGEGTLHKIGPGTVFHNCEYCSTGNVQIDEGAFGFHYGEIKYNNPAITVNPGGFYANWKLDESVVPPNVTFAGGGVQVPYDASAEKAGVLKLANDTQVTTWPLPIRLTVRPPQGQRVKVLSVPTALKTVTVDDFTVSYPFEAAEGFPKATVEIVPNESLQDIYIQVRPWTSFTGTGDRQWHAGKTYDSGANQYAWADHGGIVAGKDYLIKASATLRTGPYQDSIEYTYPCASMTLYQWNATIALKSYRTTFPLLVFGPGSITASSCGNRYEGQDPLRQFVSGKIQICGWDTAKSTFMSQGEGAYIALDADVSGNGVMSFDMPSWSGEVKAQASICRAIPAFTGAIDVNSSKGTASTYGLMLQVGEPLALGGPCSFDDVRGIRLRGWTLLQPTASMVLDTKWRGIYVENGGFDVPEGVDFTVRERLRMKGTMIKTGAGTFALDSLGAIGFGDNGGTLKDGEYNLMDVREGAIKPLSKLSFDNLRITMGEKAVLALDVQPADAEVAAYGLYDKNAAALTLKGTLNIRLDGDDAAMAEAKKVAICTVPDALAMTLKEKIRLPRRIRRGWRATPVTQESKDGFTTFYTGVESFFPMAIFLK